MFKSAKKEDYRLIAIELGETLTDRMTIIDLIEIIKNNVRYKNDPVLVTDLANSIIEDRKADELRQIELEKIKLEKAKSEEQRQKSELELARLRLESKFDTAETEKEGDKFDSLDSLVKSIRTLTIKVPSRAENWGFFFSSLERAFLSKNVPNKYKAEILLNLLGEKASNIIIYIKDHELNDYDKVKSIILREFEPTPQTCLEQFRKTTRQSNETHLQFASRLSTSWDYYLKLRKVSDFETLKQLIVSDKLFQTLDKETASHISIKQAESWFEPLELAKAIDLYFTSRGKSLSEHSSVYRNPNVKNISKVFLSDLQSSKCTLCNENHPLFKCPNYRSLSVNDRVELVRKNNLCFNCLRPHKVITCKSNYSCGICKKRHHITLHFKQEQNSTRQQAVGSDNLSASFKVNEKEKQRSVNNSPLSAEFTPTPNRDCSHSIGNNLFAATSYISNKSKTVLLSTVICYLKDELGETHKVRALLDVGSMSNFITKDCVDKLSLKKDKINILVSGLNDLTFPIKHRVTSTLININKDFQMDLNFLVVPRITDFTPSRLLKVDVPELNNIKLADKNFNVPGQIDILLGAEVFYEFLRPGQIYPPNSKLILQNTIFGYVVNGSVSTINENKIHCGFVKENSELEQLFEKFWSIENIENEKIKDKEAIVCDEHFEKNYSRDDNGRYIVKMPLKDNPICLGKSKNIALKKLNSLWNRLLREPNYLLLYREFLKEYRELGHMNEINEHEEQEGMYFIPHLGVYRPEKSTTKLRVVFNASSPTTNGNSLNSLQYNGGVIQEDLFSLMVRFRKHMFAFTADIEKMYRMIWIHPSQRNLQRILWKEEINKPVKTYELATVTYGTVSAPFLAMRTLKQLAIDEAESFPLAAPILMNDFYMDDVLTGAENLNTAKELQSQLIGILKKAGMNLHKWCSNNSELAVNTEKDYLFTNPEEIKALGVVWRPMKDCFSFKVNIESTTFYTKRVVLSAIARIFDPLGLLGPVVSKAKIFMQKLWLLKIDWSESLPLKEMQEWKTFIESMKYINDINIERCFLIEKAHIIEFHGFADASESAYGAVIYCKSTTTTGSIAIKLVASKSRVAPIKRVSIPRLELCAAVLLAKLIHKVKEALKLNLNKIYLWSDSMIVLSWIQKESFQLKTFVANRVATIQELTSRHHWRHIPSEDNPADLISRGMDPEKLLQSRLWWNGPMFLTTEQYPEREILTTVIQEDINCELKNCLIMRDSNYLSIFNININSFIYELLNLSNKYIKIIRILSYIFRFFRNCKNENKRAGPLDVTEIKKAELILIKLVQGEEFKKEIKKLQETGIVNPDSQVKNLNPFIDKDGILRIGGRLSNSNLSYNRKFPIILPSKHKLTKLIIEYFHQKYLHLGAQALLYQVRQQFWPLNGRNTCRKIVHECITCFKVKPITCQQIMADLPRERVNENFPFNCTGVDFCGPFWIKYKNQRKGIYLKIYVAIFVCFVTRAVHLEIVTELTSQAFIATLKRFFARRGRSSNLFSDNAKNFVGSNIELKKLYNMVNKPDETLSGYLTSEYVSWKFLPPRAPNFGGLWEAGVKSFKYHLKRVVGKAKLTYEEFLTITVQIEGILNSRPLCPLSSDIDDLSVLTPGHFLIGRPITTIVEPNLTHIADNRLKLYQRITKIVQLVWKKWSSDYISNLQQRSKWFFEKDNVKVGDLVLIKEDNLAVCNYQLGRIIEIFPGRDNKVRVVNIKTQQGIIKRTISKICVLPLENGNCGKSF